MVSPSFINIKGGSAWAVESLHGIVHAKSLSSSTAIGVVDGRREVASMEKSAEEVWNDAVDQMIEGWHREVALGPKADEVLGIEEA